MNRVMALDFGDARIGIAMSDIMKIIANGYETYKRVNEEKDLQYIVSLVKPNMVDEIVFGLPINMDGSEGDRVLKTRDFAGKLQELLPNTKIAFQDERLTTVTGERMLIEAGVRREKRKGVIDKIAATIILQQYL
ncbi:MAG: Holliday junction resolvase RuvX, partial [Clostridia bacterium]|nr:Holliday junction resolvase RuvX [Clostridia bacterium]